METSFSDTLEFLYKNTEYEVVTRYRDQFQWQRGVTLQKHWMWAGHPILRPVSVTPWSVSTKTLNMRWWPDIKTSFSDNVKSLYKNNEYEVVPDMDTSFSDSVECVYKNTEYEVVTRYRDEFQWQREVSLQKHWILGGDPIWRPLSVTTWSLSTKTLNMRWWPDMETSFSDNLESLYKNTEYEGVTRYGD